MSKKLEVSIIIPTYNEERYILECLNSLKDQEFQSFEIIIVDDGSTDRTKEIINDFIKSNNQVRLIKGEHKGPGFSRNKGAENSKGKILVFVDADMTFRKDYLKNLVYPLIHDKQEKIIGTTHNFEVAKNMDNVWSKCWGKVRVSIKDAVYSDEVVVFRAIRKKYFKKFGGYDPSLGYADDQTFFIKHKAQPYIAKDTVCYHRNPESLTEVYKQSRWIGASINNTLVSKNFISYFTPFLLYLLSPIIIPYLSIRRCIKLKSINLIFPMILFMAARLYGTISGIIRKVYLDKNYR